MTELIANREQNELADGWAEVVNISDEYTDLHQEVTDMLAEFEPMWDVHLGTINVLEVLYRALAVRVGISCSIRPEEGRQPLFLRLLLPDERHDCKRHISDPYHE